MIEVTLILQIQTTTVEESTGSDLIVKFPISPGVCLYLKDNAASMFTFFI